MSKTSKAETALAKAEEAVRKDISTALGYGVASEASFYKDSMNVVAAPVHAEDQLEWDYGIMDELVDLISMCGRITTSLIALGITPPRYRRLLEEARRGEPDARDAVLAITQARAMFEIELISKTIHEPHSALVKLIERVFPEDWHTEGKGKTNEPTGQTATQIVVIPSNGRDLIPEGSAVIDVPSTPEER